MMGFVNTNMGVRIEKNHQNGCEKNKTATIFFFL